MRNILAVVFFLSLAAHFGYAQNARKDSIDTAKRTYDSLYILEFEQPQNFKKPKVLHAEPLYIDLMRDLGAHKGESEWNVAGGITDRRGYDEYEGLVEYEWAVIDRLGLEIEVPFTLFSRNDSIATNIEVPSNRIESLKLAAQWSFLVSEKHQSTLALGYIHEFKLEDLSEISADNWFKGNLFNPFLVAAKRLGLNYHLLVYTGPKIFSSPNERTISQYDINTNFHYKISGTRNFVGVEINQQIANRTWNTVLRPQMRLEITDDLLIGIVTGIPIDRQSQGVSAFMRIIYEPPGQKRKFGK